MGGGRYGMLLKGMDENKMLLKPLPVAQKCSPVKEGMSGLNSFSVYKGNSLY